MLQTDPLPTGLQKKTCRKSHSVPERSADTYMTCVIDNVIREKAKEATKETNIQAPILTNT